MSDTTRRVIFRRAASVRGYGAFEVGATANLDVATATDLVRRDVAAWYLAPVTRPTLEEFVSADIADLEDVVIALRNAG